MFKIPIKYPTTKQTEYMKTFQKNMWQPNINAKMCFMFAMEIFQKEYKTKQKVEYFQYLVGEHKRELKKPLSIKVKKTTKKKETREVQHPRLPH